MKGSSDDLVGGKVKIQTGVNTVGRIGSNAQGVMKIEEHRDSHRCSLLSKRWHCKAATSPLRAVEKAGQSSTCKVGRTTVGTQRFTLRFGQVQALSSGETESSKESWMAWHRESARSSEEVRGVSGIVQELQNLHDSSSQQSSAVCWRSGSPATKMTT